MRRVIGNIESGIVIVGVKGAGFTIKEYIEGEEIGSVTVNAEDLQELFEILGELQ